MSIESIPLALAQTGAPGGGLQPFIPLILILAVFYFLLVRPQQKRAKEHQALVDNLKKNDRVVTAGGIHGRVIEVGESTVTLEVAPNVQIRHERSQINAREDEKKKEG